MKKYLWSVLPLALFAAGCEDPCETGINLRNDEATLEAVLYETLLQPSILPATCSEVSKSWNKKLANGARFASKIADEHFYGETRECLSGHYVESCRGDADSHTFPHQFPYDPSQPREPFDPRPPQSDCRKEFICSDMKVMPHKKDGYDQAKEVSRLLLGVKTGITNACLANAAGDIGSALAHATEAKARIPLVKQKTDYVLTKAGCFNRRGN